MCSVVVGFLVLCTICNKQLELTGTLLRGVWGMPTEGLYRCVVAEI